MPAIFQKNKRLSFFFALFLCSSGLFYFLNAELTPVNYTRDNWKITWRNLATKRKK